jgi:hypothetical protein
MKMIRDVSLKIGKPIILVAHIRKADRRNSGALPNLDEIHGSSDIAKIATRVITLAPAGKFISKPSPVLFPTFFKVLKNRVDGSRCSEVAVINFDVSKNSYDNNFLLGKFNYDETEFETTDEWPDWALERK